METNDTFHDDFDKFRREQFPRLCDGTVYADWAGAALPPRMLIEGYCKSLGGELLGNPHSAHSPSVRAMDLIEQARSAVLGFFNADPSEYDVIFTAGATSAILLLQHFIFEGVPARVCPRCGERYFAAGGTLADNGLDFIGQRRILA